MITTTEKTYSITDGFGNYLSTRHGHTDWVTWPSLADVFGEQSARDMAAKLSTMAFPKMAILRTDIENG